MSRRKQAKPRAVHKAGELDEPLNQNTSSQLLDPKAELLSDNDTEDDDDHTAEIDDHDTVADISEEPPKINQNNGIHLELTDSLRQTGGNIRNLKINVMTNLPSELNDQIDDEMEIFEDVGLEDENSLDSFYSDLYSSHTSASYSPSISEGTATPNSLNHHSLDIHHHHNLNNNHHHPHNELTGEIENNNHIRGGNRNHNLRRRSISSVNGGGSETLRDINGAEDDEDDDDDDDDNNNGDDENAENNHKNDIGSDDERITKANGARRQNIKKLSTAATTTTTAAAVSTDVTKVATNNSVAAGGNAGKFSIGKLRKIERDSMKSEKMTSDGIKNTSDGSYQCQFCDKSFPRLGYLKKHEQSHAEHLPFKCDYCARLFKHKRSRDRHTKLHTGDRRYRCPHCEAAFSRSDHLKIHMKTHDNQKPFQCTICNRGYNTAAALTSHMQNHKKQAALLAAGGVPSNMNYSPRSTGSGSSNGSYHKRRYGTIENSPAHLPEYPKRVRNSYISCIYCTKTDFANLEQLNAHIQTMHENVAVKEVPNISMGSPGAALQLSCEYCTMKFPNIPKMFQHMRTTHIDRLASPNTYFEQFNRLAATGTFSPRLATPKDSKVKTEEPSPKMEKIEAEKEDEPTDLSQPKRRSQTPSLNSDAAEKPGIFLCNQCNAGLPDFETFRNHLKTHITQGINLVCHHCGLTLREQSEYERHIISHFLITNSEYACSANCNKTFAKPDELHKHLFDNHVQTMYKCTLCSDLFVTKLSLKVHFACDHSQENKVFRCSACMDSFRTENDFGVHVKTRHQTVTGTSIQCMFCRMVCSSELEMHFHLAAHGRQFRCPSCPETFHVEFLLDRHMQTHHNTKENGHISPIIASNPTPIYLNPPFAKQAVPQNNNNNILDYHAFAANKNLFPNSSGKFYSPLQVDTNAIGGQIKHPLMYGLGQRYFDTNKTLLDMYNYHQEKSAANYFVSPNPPSFEHSRTPKPSQIEKPNERTNSNNLQNGFSCGICERNDFRTEAEVHSHRKIVHNLKTGVSLRCAYCSGNFKSRSELEHHMKTCHNSTGKHKCLICDEIFPSPAILAEHKLQHSKVGQSGKCSHCSASLDSISAFKSHLSEHNSEGNIPVQCICCRQTLNSDFEVGLHAKFHTKSSNAPENTCALCLEPIGPNSDAKVCEKCCRKHNLSSKLSNMRFEATKSFVENRCNLCKMILPHAQRLQEHLVEHTFVGCEERGYTCYICSAVFTVPAGLLSHMNEHGQNARPYDCNLCTEKYFFRAELDNHLVDHENGSKAETQNHNHNGNENARLLAAYHQKDNENRELSSAKADNPTTVEVKRELEESAERHENDDDDEYIEVEKVPEPTNTNATCTSSNDKELNDEQF